MKIVNDLELNFMALIYAMETKCQVDKALYEFGLIDKSHYFYKKLSDKDIKEIINLKQYKGCTYSKIESLYGLTSGTIKSRIYRYRKRRKSKIKN